MTIGRTRLGPQCQGHKQTTDATADQLLLTCPIPFKHSATVDLWIIGIATSGDKLVEHSVHSVTRDGATATYIGEVSNGSYSSGAGAWVTTVDCTGTGLRVRVTGEAAHTIEWHCVARFEPSAVNVPIVWECATTDTTQSWTTRVTAGINYWFEWGDGNFDAFVGTGANQAPAHNYTAAGNYAVRIMIDDRATIARLSGGANGLRGMAPIAPGLTAIRELRFATNYISGGPPDTSACASLAELTLNGNALSGTIPSFTLNVALAQVYLYDNAFTDYTASTIAATCVDFRVHNNLLHQSAIDQILADFETGVAGRPAAGNIALGGTGNAAPSAAGLASKAAILAAKPAWTITHN